MVSFLQFPAEQITAKPHIDEDLRMMLLQADVESTMLGIFRALGIWSCGLFVALADSEPDVKSLDGGHLWDDKS